MKRIYLATIGVMSIAVLSGGVTAAATPILQGNTENEVDFIPGNEEEIDVELPEKEPEVEIDPIDPEVTGPFTLVNVPISCAKALRFWDPSDQHRPWKIRHACGARTTV